MEFPFGLYSQFSSGSQSGNSTSNYYSNSNIDAKVNRICRNIASSIIRSAKSRDEEDDTTKPIHFTLPKIPKPVIIFSVIVITKIGMFLAYKAAQKAGMECLDL